MNYCLVVTNGGSGSRYSLLFVYIGRDDQPNDKSFGCVCDEKGNVVLVLIWNFNI